MIMLFVVCRGPFRSEARYIQSLEPDDTWNVTGIASELAVVGKFGEEGLTWTFTGLGHIVHPDKAQWCSGGPAETGKLQGFAWSDITCDACGGRGSNECMIADGFDARQYTCRGETQHAVVFVPMETRVYISSSDPIACMVWLTANNTCCCNDLNCNADSCATEDICTTSLYFGFQGDDKYGRPFTSGYQIARVDEFSLLKFYENARAAVRQWEK
jgi:hypothetical protein